MKKFILLIFLSAVSINFAQLRGAKISTSETLYDFGDVEQGQIVSHNFDIFNTGDDLLKITNIKTSCGCTVVQPDKKVLKPGESTTIKVSFDSGKRRGKQRKHVYVFSNDKKIPELRLSFTANVVIPSSGESALSSSPKLKIERTQHNFGTVNEGEILDLVLKYQNVGNSLLKINDIRSSCGCAVALLNKKELKPGDEGKIRIEFDTTNRFGRLTRTVTIFSNDPIKPRQVITLSVNIQKKES